MNREMIEDGVRKILEGIGEDVTRPGLVDTPKRVAKKTQMTTVIFLILI